MVTAPCCYDVFEQLDDAARVEAYRSAVSEGDVLRTEVVQLWSELQELKLMIFKVHDAAKDDDAPKSPLDSQMTSSHNFRCNLLARLVERIKHLELKTHENSDAESSTSAEESSASMNFKCGSRKQQKQARSDTPVCMSNSEDARDRLSSFVTRRQPQMNLQRLPSQFVRFSSRCLLYLNRCQWRRRVCELQRMLSFCAAEGRDLNDHQFQCRCIPPGREPCTTKQLRFPYFAVGIRTAESGVFHCVKASGSILAHHHCLVGENRFRTKEDCARGACRDDYHVCQFTSPFICTHEYISHPQ
ncbi:hypothetical protein HPB51_000662 [Rhipicephalus microplus]|uniref:Uncharacterized protein n=1 Tax=Rhipicephalus microplus TaxID=6941 RepID=A0A9J6DS95_RHIMP|nr:hypothetical protein HPB51_000662 [Rhipicephalus microplus]